MSMKKTIICYMFISVIMCLCACGKENNKENTGNSTQETTKVEDNFEETTTVEEVTTVDDFILLPDEQKIAKDINQKEKVTFEINTGSYKLETKEVKIEKAVQDNKKYTIYCYATQENEEYKAENYYLLVYNYYDIGGWVLDEYTIQEKNITPRNGCDMQFVCNNLQAEFNLTKCDYVKLDKVSDTEYVYYFNGIREYNYMVENFDLVVNCIFDKEYGWHLDNDYTYRSEDWSKICGTWYGEEDGSSNTIIIKNVDYINRLITLNVNTKSRYFDGISLDVVIEYENMKESLVDNGYPKYYKEIYTEPDDICVAINFDENYGLKYSYVSRGTGAYMSKID